MSLGSNPLTGSEMGGNVKRRSRRIALALAATSMATMMAAPLVSNAGLLGDGGVAWRTLAEPAPGWYTPELQREVVAAGPSGVAVPAGVTIPTSSLVFLGIRPGQLMLLTGENGTSLCTSNFVFTNGANYFIGTAGHCGEAGDQVTMLYLPGGLVDIGSVVLSTGDAGIGNDFALVSIKPALSGDVSPSMAYWGGPTGVYTGSGPAVVQHAGWGAVIGTGGTPRVGIGVDFSGADWRFAGAITPGDSGSAANVLGGAAAGNITHIAVDSGEIPPAFMTGTSIGRILQIASGYQLVTCPSAIPWPLPGCP
jgi:hypothetical protein